MASSSLTMGRERTGCRGSPSFNVIVIVMSLLLLGRSSSSSALLLRPRPLAFVAANSRCAGPCCGRDLRCGLSASSAASPSTTGSNDTAVTETSRSQATNQHTSEQDPWSHPRVLESTVSRRKRKSNKARFRQHVNPLARQYQQPCDVSLDWPRLAYQDASLPLHVDIGCGKGGFLLDLASAAAAPAPPAVTSSSDDTTNGRAEIATVDKAQDDTDSLFWSGRRRNMLGLEIRPLVAQHAKEKLAQLRLARSSAPTNDNTSNDDWTRRVDFIGCNVNVDLDRILSLYTGDSTRTPDDGQADDDSSKLLEVVTIQFPDPHFKSYHAKRRVVNADLVLVVAKHMRVGKGHVFLQSDIPHVLDDMRQQFAAHPLYFTDLSHANEYYPHNVFDVPTERELSVLEKGLPVYRALFARTSVPFDNVADGDLGA